MTAGGFVQDPNSEAVMPQAVARNDRLRFVQDPDSEAVMRFANATINGQQADPDDALHAAWALLHCLKKDGPPLRQVLSVKRRGRGPKHDMSLIYIGHPAFGIAMARAAGTITEADAIEAICQTFGDIDERTSGKYLAQLEPRARRVIDTPNTIRVALEARKNNP